MAPNASAKIASEAAITRLRIRAMRAARARSFALASSLGDRPGRAERSELGVGVGSCMSAKVGAPCESGPGRARGLPGDASTLDQDPGRSRAAPGCGADHLAHETEGPQRLHHHLVHRRLTIIESGADVAALGGFSGRESQVSVTWLA